jgi:hypothetical protein
MYFVITLITKVETSNNELTDINAAVTSALHFLSAGRIVFVQ